jgi:Raf kinase inhibitor-like YbhB/YbcL family protein
VSPALNFSEVPASAKTLALIVEDPDASMGTFIHWVIWNIPADVSGLEEGQLPEGSVVGRNTLKQNDYIPACPPSGAHHYFFTLYALDTVVSLPISASKIDLLTKIQSHILEQAELIGLYQR